jgi:hypothetical protein
VSLRVSAEWMVRDTFRPMEGFPNHGLLGEELASTRLPKP